MRYAVFAPPSCHVAFRVFLLVFAVAGLLIAQFNRQHLGLPMDWQSLPFYYLIPAAQWLLFYPVVIWLAGKYDIRHGREPVFAHLIISIAAAIALRVSALSIDFAFQSATGWLTGTFVSFLYDIRFLIFTSTWEQVLLYWLLIGLVYLRSKEQRVPRPSHLSVKTDRGLTDVEFDAILFAEAYGNYVKLHTAAAIICVRTTMTNIGTQLPSSDFFRIHRSYIVNAKFVRHHSSGGDRTYLLGIGTVTIKSSRQYARVVRELIATRRGNPSQKSGKASFLKPADNSGSAYLSGCLSFSQLPGASG